jgi:putative glutamine amidotransferase
VYNKAGHPTISVMEAYTRALSQAGAAPVMIPLGLPEETLGHIISRLDGILFTGGGDVQPQFYGAQPHPKVDLVDDDRDRVEIHLLRQLIQTGRPFLGICRGIQVINVALGGTLYTDVLDQHAGAIKHDFYPDWPRNHLAHQVTLAESRLARILGSIDVAVNSLHHQGLRDLAPDLQALGYAPDGLVEAVELHGYPFGLAVQWHPEWLTEHASMRALFAAFIEAADGKARNT